MSDRSRLVVGVKQNYDDTKTYNGTTIATTFSAKDGQVCGEEFITGDTYADPKDLTGVTKLNAANYTYAILTRDSQTNQLNLTRSSEQGTIGTAASTANTAMGDAATAEDTYTAIGTPNDTQKQTFYGAVAAAIAAYKAVDPNAQSYVDQEKLEELTAIRNNPAYAEIFVKMDAVAIATEISTAFSSAIDLSAIPAPGSLRGAVRAATSGSITAEAPMCDLTADDLVAGNAQITLADNHNDAHLTILDVVNGQPTIDPRAALTADVNATQTILVSVKSGAAEYGVVITAKKTAASTLKVATGTGNWKLIKAEKDKLGTIAFNTAAYDEDTGVPTGISENCTLVLSSGWGDTVKDAIGVDNTNKKVTFTAATVAGAGTGYQQIAVVDGDLKYAVTIKVEAEEAGKAVLSYAYGPTPFLNDLPIS